MGLRAKTGGRVKGTANLVTQDIKKTIESIICETFTPEKVKVDLAAMEPKERLSLLIKLCEFTIPKMKSIDQTIEMSDKPTFVFQDWSGKKVDMGDIDGSH